MVDSVKGIAILGSTGSIGTQTLDVVRSFPGRFNVHALAAGRNRALLERQVKEFRPSMAYCEAGDEPFLPAGGCAAASLDDIARAPEVDVLVTATVGDVALKPTFAAIEAGKNIALANKETVVMAGGLLSEAAARRGVEVLPLDSEPSAIWQCLRGEPRAVSRLIITASGGAFRGVPAEKLADVTPEQALRHPTWSMGRKITIDAATLANKAFEVIEAHYLFGVPWENIEVVVHPQSMIHSMVEFADGSVKAQISPPDMRLPIHYALFYPERVPNPDIPRFDALAVGSLTFEPLDEGRYPMFRLILDAAMKGGTWPAAVCGADEAAVDMFLRRRIGFLEIERVVREALAGHAPAADPTAEQALDAAAWAKARVASIVGEGGA